MRAHSLDDIDPDASINKKDRQMTDMGSSSPAKSNIYIPWGASVGTAISIVSQSLENDGFRSGATICCWTREKVGLAEAFLAAASGWKDEVLCAVGPERDYCVVGTKNLEDNHRIRTALDSMERHLKTLA